MKIKIGTRGSKLALWQAYYVQGKLEAQNIPYADYGKWAMAGWYQIFFHDPDGNIIEVHQTGL